MAKTLSPEREKKIEGTNVRREERTSHVSIINYSEPATRSAFHESLLGILRKLVPFGSNGKSTNGKSQNHKALRKNTAVTFDLSKSGLGICTTKPLGPGQKLLIFNSKWQEAPIPATVKWCKKHSDIFYRVGLIYSQ